MAWKEVPQSRVKDAWDRCEILPAKASDDAIARTAADERESEFASLGESLSALAGVASDEQRPMEVQEVLSVDDTLEEYIPAQRSFEEIHQELGCVSQPHEGYETADEAEQASAQPPEDLTACRSSEDIVHHLEIARQWAQRYEAEYSSRLPRSEPMHELLERCKSCVEKVHLSSRRCQATLDYFVTSNSQQ